MPTGVRSPRTSSSERGAVGGADVLALGVLILIAGTLALVNIWSIVDTRAALDAAARDYLRSYTEQADHDAGAQLGTDAVLNLLDQRGTPLTGLRIIAPTRAAFGPCEIATVELIATVPAARIPFLDSVGRRRVSIRHSEMIDPHREVTPGELHDPSSTICAE